MSDEYTPTTEEIIRGFTAPLIKIDPVREGESFSAYLSRVSMESFQVQMASEAAARRWLAAHDAKVRADAWIEGHAAGRDYQGDGWNSDAHDPEEDNPYRAQLNGENDE